MRIRLLYFAVLRDLTGLDGEELEVPEGTDVAGLAVALEERHEPLRGRLQHVRFARNAVFVASTEPLAANDEVALIPPVAGG